MTGLLLAKAAVPERSYEEAAILDLLPHRGCMLMLRRLTVHGSDAFAGEACWQDDHPFVRAHGSSFVPATLLLEAAAQTAGAGLLAVEQAAGKPERSSLGLLAGVRHCTFVRPVQTGLPVVFQVKTRFMSPLLAHGLVDVFQSQTSAATLQVLLAMPGSEEPRFRSVPALQGSPRGQ